MLSRQESRFLDSARFVRSRKNRAVLEMTVVFITLLRDMLAKNLCLQRILDRKEFVIARDG